MVPRARNWPNSQFWSKGFDPGFGENLQYGTRASSRVSPRGWHTVSLSSESRGSPSKYSLVNWRGSSLIISHRGPLLSIQRTFKGAMPAHPEEIFKPNKPGTPVATLVLIENSRDMIHGWPDLRDHHLPTLLGTMRLANPIVPVRTVTIAHPMTPSSFYYRSRFYG